MRCEINAADGRIQNHTLLRSEDVRLRAGAVKPGGVTMAYALHTWALSLTQLRRLSFPFGKRAIAQVAPEGERGRASDQNVTIPDQRNHAARTVLAAVALYALALQQESGYWLRSRCELVPEGPLVLEQIGGDGGMFSLGTAAEARTLLTEAIREAESSQIDLEWPTRVIVLTPTEKLRRLVEGSDAQGPESVEGEEPTHAGAAS